MSDERRSQGRVPAYIDVLWEGASGKYEARTGDIHTGGCFIDSIGEVGVGETIRFSLRLPNEDWIEVKGVVAYKYPNAGFGVRFLSISSEDDRKRLEWLVKAQAYRAEKG
ncbi:MAG: PilZ domain-containing protein [Pyrinomonadaceae bacterium]